MSMNINNFGNLTNKAGQRIRLEDLDTNGDGKVQKEELTEFLKENKLDEVTFLSKVDKDNSGDIDADEFALWEQKEQMQTALNNLSKQISTDFSGGKAQYIKQVQTELTSFFEGYADTYLAEDGNEVSGLAAAFLAELPQKYAEIKEGIAGNQDNIKSQVIDAVVSSLGLPSTNEVKATEGGARGGEIFPSTLRQTIAKAVEKEADAYIKANGGSVSEEELTAHLEEFLYKSDYEKMEDAITNWNNTKNVYGDYIDSNELASLKEDVKTLLMTAIEQGVTINLGGSNIKTEAAVTTALKKFNDGQELIAAVDAALSEISKAGYVEKKLDEYNIEQARKAHEAYMSIPGSAYQVNAGTLDYSTIPGYYSDEKFRTKGKSGHDEKLRDQAMDTINQSTLKDQMKKQIMDMLNAQGVPFDKVANIFENCYTDALRETLEGITSTKINHRWLNKNKKYETDQGIKTLVDNFITNFNTKIAAAIDEMNASDKDFDTVDLDLTHLGEDENGNKIETENNDDLLRAYQSGQTLKTERHGADYYNSIAEKVIDGMKAQMLSKFMAMCDANGVEFDNTAFNTMFNNAKGAALAKGVSGIDAKGQKYVGGIAGASVGVAAGAAAASGALTPLFTSASLAAAVPGAGWFIGGASLLAVALLSIFGSGRHSESSLDMRALVDTFTQDFKTNSESWVEGEKNKTKKDV